MMTDWQPGDPCIWKIDVTAAIRHIIAISGDHAWITSRKEDESGIIVKLTQLRSAITQIN